MTTGRTIVPAPHADDDSGYWEAYRASLRDPSQFWLDAAAALRWTRSPEVGHIRDDNGPGQWFPDGVFNTAYNAIDRHVEAGRGADIAIHYCSTMTGQRQRISFAQLRHDTARLAGALRMLGVEQGDRVLIYLPMVPEAVLAMLACARLGAVHVVVFGGFGASELAARIEDAQPRVILAATCGLEPQRVIPYGPILHNALQQSAWTPAHLVMLERDEVSDKLQPQDRFEVLAKDIAGAAESTIRTHNWQQLVRNAPEAECVAVAATDPLYILYTSGTTGAPKGIVRDNGGHAVALHWSMEHVYDVAPGDVVFAASDIGWVVGHSYIVYAPLLRGAATVLYEGKPIDTPDAHQWWRMIEGFGVNVLLAAPTAIRAIRQKDPTGAGIRTHNLDSLRSVFLAGEKVDPDTQRWLNSTLGLPVVDNWWQTETGWPVLANPLGLHEFPTKPGSSTFPVPGFDVVVLDDQGRLAAVGQEGAVCLRLPLPPGAMSGVRGGAEPSYFTEFPGYYSSGDGGFVDEDGYVYILGRTDDVMNVAGHRLASGQIEAAICDLDAIAECAVVGVSDDLKGQRPHALVVLDPRHQSRAGEVTEQVRRSVRERIGPIASLGGVDVVQALPKTRSGKILRRSLRDLLDGREVNLPPTIESAEVFDQVRADLAESLLHPEPTRKEAP